ncbi:MAG: ELWxxDGT repeat protein [Pirellulaceae bacterium]
MMAIDLVADIVQTPNSSDVTEIIDISTFASKGMAMSAFTHEGWELVTQNDSGVRTIHTWPNTDLRPMELTHFQDNIGQSWVYFSGVSEFSDRELFRLKVGFNEVTRVKDINLFGSSDPKDLTVVGNSIYFTAWTSVSGRELWKTDGTSAGTVLVEDLKSGFGSGSNPEELTKFGNLLLFSANDGVAGRELWISGGTANSTFMVKDVNPGIASSNPRELTVAGDKVFFSAFNHDSGREVWKSDGISTSILKNLSPGTGSSNPEELTARNSQLFFTASLSGTGRELYWYEPTSIQDTVLVKDIFPGTEGSNPKNLTVVDNNLLYFSAHHPTSGLELWKSNGFFAGTVLVKDLNTNGSSAPHNLVAVGNRLYFAATDLTQGTELFKSDGTAASTVMVANMNLGGPGSYPSVMTPVFGKLALSADNGSSGAKAGREVWTTSGAVDTTQLHDVFPGNQSSYPDQLTQLGNDIYFIAYASDGNAKLFRANADALGTATEIATGDASFSLNFYGTIAAVGNNLYFTKRSLTGSDRIQLLKYVPATGTTTLMKEFNGPFGNNRPSMIASGNFLYVVAQSADNSYQLWTSDGSANGTLRLKSGTNFTDISSITDVNGKLYFRATVGTGTAQLWRSIGTNATTIAIPNLIDPIGFIVKNDQIYFSASDGTTTNFYRINMTNAPAVIRAGIQCSSQGVNLNGMMFFGAIDLTNQAVGY